MKKNLGSEIKSFVLTTNEETGASGVTVEFERGDICDPVSNQRYSSTVNMICDTTQDYGWPIHKGRASTDCHKIFEWKTS